MEYVGTWMAPNGFKVVIERSQEFDLEDIKLLCKSMIEAIDKNDFLMVEKPLE